MTIAILVILLHIAGCIAIERNGVLLHAVQMSLAADERHATEAFRLNERIVIMQMEQRRLIGHVDALHADIDRHVRSITLDMWVLVSPEVTTRDIVVSVDFGNRHLRLETRDMIPPALESMARRMGHDCARQVEDRFMRAVTSYIQANAFSNPGRYLSRDELTAMRSERYLR